MSDLLSKARQGLPLGVPVIDMHAHLGLPNFGLPGASAEAIVGAMDRVGVSWVALSTMATYSPDAFAGNRVLLEALQRWPDRMIGYVSLWPESAERVSREVEALLAAGFSGIKLHNANGFAYDDPAYDPAWQAAQERRLPVLLHSWGEAAMFAQVRRQAVRYPEASILLAHTGCSDEAGYVQIARELPNVYLELALSRSPRGLVQRLVEAVGAARVVWGSDAAFLALGHQVGKVVGADVSEESKRLVLGGNAQRLLDRILR